MNGQHHVPTALPLGKEPVVPTEQNARWTREPVWKLWGRNKSVPIATILRKPRLDITHCTDSTSGTKYYQKNPGAFSKLEAPER